MKIELHTFRDRDVYSRFVASSTHVVPKNELIEALCTDKTVLDVGSIDHSWETALELGEQWPFLRIQRVAKSVVGLDLLQDDATVLRQRGFEIVYGNAESFDLGRTFEIIVCGDIIEHLSNIGSFLDSIKHHMTSSSLCLVTTPNPFNIEQIMLAIFHKRIGVNRQHSVWIDPQVMYEAVRRHALGIVGFYWVKTRFKMPVRRKFYGWVANAVSEFIMRKRPLCKRDFAVILRRLP